MRFTRNIIILSGITVLNLANAAIPPQEAKGLGTLFSSKYKKYSPLVGMVYSREYIPNIFHYGSEAEASFIRLIHQLFTEVPGGEITPTHLYKNPAAHLSASGIAKIFVEFERTVQKYKGDGPKTEAFVQELRDKISEAVLSDEGYFESTALARRKTIEAAAEHRKFLASIEEEQQQIEKAEKFRADQITPLDRKITSLRKTLKKQSSEDEIKVSHQATMLKDLETQREGLTKQYTEMRKNVHTAEERKAALRKIQYQIDINTVDGETYEASFKNFVFLLAECFAKYEMGETRQAFYQNGTTLALLSFMWMKYLHKVDLRPYVLEISKIPSLTAPTESLGDRFFEDSYSSEELLSLRDQFSKSWRKQRWVENHFEEALVLTLANPMQVVAPNEITFSFIKWLKYSSFPDCCENALHNLIDLIVFNPVTKTFDVEVLKQLKVFYPKLSDALIEYYETRATYDLNNSPEAAAAWIKVASNLNDGVEIKSSDQEIHYRAGGLHLASPYSNILKALNRLFGIEDISTDHLSEIFAHTKAITGFDVQYSNDKIDNKGFGDAIFQVGPIYYKLGAYYPIHVSFKRIQPQGTFNLVNTLADVGFSVRPGSTDALFFYSGAALAIEQGLQRKQKVIDGNEVVLFTHTDTKAEKEKLLSDLAQTKIPILYHLFVGLSDHISQLQ